MPIAHMVTPPKGVITLSIPFTRNGTYTILFEFIQQSDRLDLFT